MSNSMRTNGPGAGSNLNQDSKILGNGEDLTLNPSGSVDSEFIPIEKVGIDVKLTNETKDEFLKLIEPGLKDLVEKSINEIKKENAEIKKDYLIIFGIFASFVTFISLEVQVFRNNDNIHELLGVSAISLSFILSFAFIINNIANGKTKWTHLWSPISILTIIFLLLGIFFLFQKGSISNCDILH